MTSPVRAHPMFGEGAHWLTGIYRKRMAFVMVCAEKERFRADFMSWLVTNWHVWEKFDAEANKVWDRGRRRYSARTIWEYMRHESMVREVENEKGWKLNDWYVKDCARLWVLMNPDRSEFFEFRTGQSAVRAI